MQAVRHVVRPVKSGRMFGTMQAQAVTYGQMKKSKHDFVHFTNVAIKERSSPEAKEMYKYLNKCFIDNDTDYDGLVSYKGFNNMIAEAAVAPRRFGLAPSTREMYKSKESYVLARTELFNQLKSGDMGRVTMDSWMTWALAHIKEKVGAGLAEHDLSKWERSKEDCVKFFKDVHKQGSHHNRKSSTSTQYKEFYMMQHDMFMEADKNMSGLLDKSGFDNLVKMCNAVPMKFGIDMYKGADFDKVAMKGKVGWKEWKEYSLGLVEKCVKNM